MTAVLESLSAKYCSASCTALVDWALDGSHASGSLSCTSARPAASEPPIPMSRNHSTSPTHWERRPATKAAYRRTTVGEGTGGGTVSVGDGAGVWIGM